MNLLQTIVLSVMGTIVLGLSVTVWLQTEEIKNKANTITILQKQVTGCETAQAQMLAQVREQNDAIKLLKNHQIKTAARAKELSARVNLQSEANDGALAQILQVKQVPGGECPSARQVWLTFKEATK